MRIFHQLDQIPVFKNAVITIGSFDGVHLGHAKIIEQMQAEAQQVSGESVLITFYPHPRQILNPDSAPIHILNTASEKTALLSQKAVENLVIVPFDKAFSQMKAAAYIENFLVKYFRPHSIIIGYDHRFGKAREGNYEMLERYASQFNYRVIEIPKKVLEDSGISSTRIRKAIAEADIEKANQLLGYDYFFSGTVTEGNQLGRKIGFPTANLRLEDPEKLIPSFGVFAVEVQIEGYAKPFRGMLNIGTRPTVDGKKRTTEVNIFDFDETIYGKTVTLTLKKHLRNEIKFENLEALKTQLAKDKAESLQYFSANL